MLAFDRVLAFSRLARKMGRQRGRKVVFTLTTNGTLLTERHLRFFREYGFYVGVSLDGLKEAQDRFRRMAGGRSSFDRIFSNIQLAAQWLPRLDVMMVVSPETVAALPDAVDRLRDVGVARVSLVPNVDEPWTEAGREEARGAYRRIVRRYLDTRLTQEPIFVHPFVEMRAARETGTSGRATACGQSSCGFGLSEIAVAPSGRIYPCARLVGDDSRPDIALGHVDRGCSAERAHALRDSARRELTACDNDGSCMCVPHMPGYEPARGERLHFLQTLAHEVLDEALAPAMALAG